MVTVSDEEGYFSGSFPVGTFTEAFGMISGENPQNTPIRLEESGNFPENVILIVDIEALGEPIHDEDCACHAGDHVPRDPDNTDLVTSSVFSTDMQGGCVNFTKPNRVLEEFSYYHVIRTTEPEIKGFTLEDERPNVPYSIVAQYMHAFGGFTNNDVTPMSLPPSATDGVFETAATHSDLNPTNLQLRFDPEIFKSVLKGTEALSPEVIKRANQLTLVRDFSHLLKAFRIKGNGRVNLNCKNVVDWDDEPTIYQACTIAHGHILNFKQEWVADGYSLGDLLYSLPLAPCQKKQISILDWERRESGFRSENLSEAEALSANLSRDRDILDIQKGTLNEQTEGGSSASTGGFGAGLGIGGIFKGVGALLGIGGGYSKAGSNAWQKSSRQASATALQQLRDRTSQSASAVRNQRSTVIQTVRQGERVTAQTEVVANHNHCHAITMQYFEVLRHFLVRQRLVDVQECLFVPLMMSKFTNEKALRWRESLRFYLRNRKLRKGFDAIERIENFYQGSDLPFGSYADESLENLTGDLTIRFQMARPKDEADEFAEAAWNWATKLIPWISPSSWHRTYLTGQARKDQIFQRELAPTIAENFVQKLQFFAVMKNGSEIQLPVDPTLVSNYFNNRRLHVTLRLAETLPAGLVRKNIEFIRISNEIDGAPIRTFLPANTRVIVDSGNLRYRTKYQSDFLFRDARIQNDLSATDDVLIHTPLNRRELRNPRHEDIELAKQLLDHLNEHIEYYHKRIWWRMNAQRRYMLLDGIVAPNSSGRSVASVVENRLIGIVGNCLILPVARGFKLDPTYNQNAENPIDLLEHYAPNTPIEPARMAIPTKGIYAESVMG